MEVKRQTALEQQCGGQRPPAWRMATARSEGWEGWLNGETRSSTAGCSCSSSDPGTDDPPSLDTAPGHQEGDPHTKHCACPPSLDTGHHSRPSRPPRCPHSRVCGRQTSLGTQRERRTGDRPQTSLAGCFCSQSNGFVDAVRNDMVVNCHCRRLSSSDRVYFLPSLIFNEVLSEIHV